MQWKLSQGGAASRNYTSRNNEERGTDDVEGRDIVMLDASTRTTKIAPKNLF